MFTLKDPTVVVIIATCAVDVLEIPTDPVVHELV